MAKSFYRKQWRSKIRILHILDNRYSFNRNIQKSNVFILLPEYLRLMQTRRFGCVSNPFLLKPKIILSIFLKQNHTQKENKILYAKGNLHIISNNKKLH